MKKSLSAFPNDEEKLSTLRLYLEQKGMQVEDELTNRWIHSMAKNVPAGVREFLNMRSGNAELLRRSAKAENGAETCHGGDRS